MKYSTTFSIIVLMCFNSFAHEVKSSDDPVKYSINRYTKDMDISFKRGTIKLTNHYGDIHIKNTNAHQLGVSVVAQELGEDPAIHELISKTKNYQAELNVHYKKQDILKHKNKSVKWPIGRVDLVVFVPRDMVLKIETTYGNIGVKKTKNWITANSVSGNIEIANQHDIEATTVSGRIKVFPMSTEWNKGINLKSTSSDIFAIVPNTNKVKLDIISSGQLNSRLSSPGSWKKVDSNLFSEKFANYRIQSQSGDIFISPHDQLK